MAKSLSLGTLFKGEIDSTFRNTVEEMKRMLGTLNGALGGVTAASEKNRSAMQSGGSEFSKYSLAIGKATEVSQKYHDAIAYGTKVFGDQGSAFDAFRSTLNKTESAIQAHGQSMIAAGKNGKSWAEHVDRLSLTMDGLRKNIKLTSKGIEDIVEPVVKASGIFSKFSTVISSMAYWGLAATAIYGTMRAIKEGVVNVMEFDQVLKNFQAVTSATTAEVTMMGQVMLDLASKTKFSMKEIQTGTVTVAQAGFSAAETIGIMKDVITLATGTISDMGNASDLLTTVIRAFNMNASESGRVADVMAVAVNKSKETVEKLNVTFSYLAPIAAAAGLSLEEVTAAAMLLTDNGLKASTVGTSLRQVIARLISPTDSLQAKFLALGADMNLLNPATSSLKTIMEELARVAPTAADAFELFGLRGAPAVAILVKTMKDGGQQFDTYYNQLFNVGAAQAMMDVQMQGLSYRAKNLLNNIQLLTIGVGSGGFSAVLGGVIDSLNSLIKGMTYLSTSIIGQYTIAMGAAAVVTWGLGKAIMAIWLAEFLSGIKTSIELIWKLGIVTRAARAELVILSKTILTFLASNLVLVVGALVGALLMWVKTQKELSNELIISGIEIQKSIDRLEDYRNKLVQLNPGTNEYGATLKRLAVDYKELAPFIDSVTGKWKDQQAGIQFLDNLLQTQHIKLMAEQAKALQQLTIEFERSFNTIYKWVFSLKDPQDQFQKLTDATLVFIPRLKELGITATSTGKEVKDALLQINSNMFSGLNSEQATALLTAVMTKLNSLHQQELEAERKKVEEKRKIAIGERREEVSLFADLYNDLEGQRRADSEKIAVKLDKDLENLKKNFEDEGGSVKAMEAERLRLAMKAREDIAEIRYKDIGTSEDVNNEVLKGFQLYIKKMRDAYFNDLSNENDLHKRKLAEAKGSNKNIQQEMNRHNDAVSLKEMTFLESLNAQWALMLEKKKHLTEEGYSAVRDSILKSTSEIQQGGGPTTLTTSVSKLVIPTTDTEIVANQERIMTSVADSLSKVNAGMTRSLKYIWQQASEVEKGYLFTIVQDLDKKLGDINKSNETTVVKNRMVRASFDEAMKSYIDTQHELNKVQTPLQKSLEKTAEGINALNISKMTDHIKKEQELFTLDVDKMKNHLEGFKKQLDIMVATGEKVDTNLLGQKFTIEPTGDIEAREKFKNEMLKELETRYNEWLVERTQEREKRISDIKTKESKKQLDTKEEQLSIETSLTQVSASAETDLRLKAYDEYKRRLLVIEKDLIRAKEVLLKEGSDKTIDYDAMANEARLKAYEKLQQDLVNAEKRTKLKSYKEESDKFDLQKAELEAAAQQARTEGQLNNTSKRNMLAMDIEFYQKDLQLRIDHYNNIKSMSETDLKVKSEHLNKAAKEVEEALQRELAKRKELYQIEHKYDEQKWRAGEISAEQYFSYIKQARDFEIIDEEEFKDKSIAVNGTMWDQIKRGYQKAKREMESWGELMIRLGKEGPDKLASGLTDAIMSFADGTKTAKEAMSDFFMSMFKWLGEAILKWTLLKAIEAATGSSSGGLGGLGGLLGSLFGLGGGGGAAFDNVAQIGTWLTPSFAHGGGVLGEDRFPSRQVSVSAFSDAIRAHSGIGPGERAIVAKDEEGIFTPGQMKALGMMAGSNKGNLNITNIVDPRLIDAYLATPQGKNSLLNLVSNNPSKFRRAMEIAT